MKNNTLFIFIGFIILLLKKIQSQSLPIVPCKSILDAHINYLTTGPSGIHRYLSIQSTFIQQNRYVAFYQGSLEYLSSIDKLNGTVTVSFSDRYWTPQCNLLFCPSQNFNYKQVDKQTITISRDGSIQFTLNSWANGKINDKLQCFDLNQPMFTLARSDTQSMFITTLQQQQYTIPK